MIPPMETYVVVALAFAVFAAVTSVGAAIVLGVGYERLRAGLERVKEGLDVLNRQTGYFSTAIFKLENKVDALDPARVRVIADEAPAVKTRKPRASKGRSKKTHIDGEATTTLNVSTADSGDITTTVSGEPGDWKSYQGLSRDEALASFAQSGKGEGKIRFM